MQALTDNEAKTQFGDMLIKAQKEPIQINKNGKPVAVVLSMEDYESIEEMKQNLLQQRFENAKREIDENQLKSGKAVFNSLLK